MKSRVTKLVLLAVLLVFAAAFSYLDIGSYLSLDYFIVQRESLERYTEQNFSTVAAVYFLAYLLAFAAALPAAAILTLLGGALFGFWWAVLLVSFASSIGSLLAFLAARFLLRDWVMARFGRRLQAVLRGIEKEGAFYLFSLRLLPLFPPALINLAMAVSPLGAWTFYWVSQLGMLAGTAVYVNAGTELASVAAGKPILTPPLLLAFALLAIFPWLARRALRWLRQRRLLTRFDRPDRFDNNLVVIGAGAGGLVSAYIAATVKAKVTLIERDKMGGDCLNTGCVPSKTLLHSAGVAHTIASASDYGIVDAVGRVDFAAVMARVERAIERVAPHDSVARYRALGVNCIEGEARILSPYRVQVGEQILTTKNIAIATGGRPAVPPIRGIEQLSYYTSDTIWNLRRQPQHLLVLGGGPIGCELAQAFRRLGSVVTLLTSGSQLLPKEDADISRVVWQRLRAEGIMVELDCIAEEFLGRDSGGILRYRREGSEGVESEGEVEFSDLLVAVGRRANTDRLGLQQLGVELSSDGSVVTDKYLRSNFSNIYAVGDVEGRYQFTHTASHQAWYAAVNALFGAVKLFKADYTAIPWATFTDPQVARVGLSESEALDKDLDIEVTRYALDELDRVITETPFGGAPQGQSAGFVKVITPRGNDKVLGAAIVGRHAAEMIGEFVSVMRRGGRLGDIMSVIHIYPTHGEANKYVAGEWQKAHKPARLLRLAERFHRFLRR